MPTKISFVLQQVSSAAGMTKLIAAVLPPILSHPMPAAHGARPQAMATVTATILAPAAWAAAVADRARSKEGPACTTATARATSNVVSATPATPAAHAFRNAIKLAIVPAGRSAPRIESASDPLPRVCGAISQSRHTTRLVPITSRCPRFWLPAT